MGARLVYRLVGTVVAVPVTFAVRRALRAVWKRSRGTEPPKSPTAPGTDWKEALTWAAASATALAVSEIIASRGVARAYQALTGRTPPGTAKKPTPRR
jgi:hypothetical protein